MKSPRFFGLLAGFAVLTIASTGRGAEPRPPWDAPPPPAGFPKFTVQEIAADFKIGYAVHLCDVNGDKKPDIVVVDKERVIWYENPTWKVRTITQGKAKPDNVCICSLDIDGDGKLDFVLGAGWKPMDTKTPGTLQWLRRGKTLDEEWEMFPIPCDEPTVHRVQTRTWEGSPGTGFVMVPLMGRDATKEKNWMDGRPVKCLEYDIPEKPTDPKQWKPKTILNELHVVHNFQLSTYKFATMDFFASYEGITYATQAGGKTTSKLIHQGHQQNPNGSRGASELSYEGILATVEPWHGNEIVAYYHDDVNTQDDIPKKLRRVVVDNKLRWGHAIKTCSDMLNEPGFFIIAGVRDNPDPKQGDKFTEKRGVRLYSLTDDKGEKKWDRYILEDGGVAVEDLQVGDLDGDGKPDIVTVGRATCNCRIYWNKGK